jgi:hypothetical protein
MSLYLTVSTALVLHFADPLHGVPPAVEAHGLERLLN